MALVAIAPSEEIKARGSPKIDDDEREGPTPVRHRARPKLGEQVSKKTIYGRARRPRRRGIA
jgi:hypothetical protein